MRSLTLFSDYNHFLKSFDNLNDTSEISQYNILGMSAYECKEDLDKNSKMSIIPDIYKNEFNSFILKGYINPFQYDKPFFFSTGAKPFCGWLNIPLNDKCISAKEKLNRFFNSSLKKIMEIRPYSTALIIDKNFINFFNQSKNPSDPILEQEYFIKCAMTWICEESLHPNHFLIFENKGWANEAFTYLKTDFQIKHCLSNLKVQLF